MPQRISSLLLIVCLGTLWIPGALILWNSSTGQKLLQGKPLLGVQASERLPPASFETLSDGSYQRAVAKAVGPAIPFYPDAVRLYNFIQYWALGLSTNRSILVGRDQYLLASSQSISYCRRANLLKTDAVQKWAGEVKEPYQLLRSRGQQFLYVLTPSKAEILPDKLPWGFPCPSPDGGEPHETVIRILTNEGIPFVDGVKLVQTSSQPYGYEPFPKGGIHWTDLSSSSTLRAVVDALNASAGRTIASQYEFTVSDAPAPQGADRDFADLLNMTWPPPANKTALIRPVTKTSDACPKPASITVVGGSYFTSIGKGLALGRCPPRVSQLNYLIVDQKNYDAAVSGGFAYSKVNLDLLRSADVVIVEENMAILAQSRHLPATLNYLKTGEAPRGGVY